MDDTLHVLAQWTLAIGILSVGALFVAGTIFAWASLFFWTHAEWRKIRTPEGRYSDLAQYKSKRAA